MAMATLTARITPSDKSEFEDFCSNVGLNVSTAINLFVKKVLSERRIPFDVSDSAGAGGFWSEENQSYLRSQVKKIRSGEIQWQQHEIIEENDE